MLGFAFKLLQVPFIQNLAGRLVNRYTASGIIILLVQLEQQGILPVGISSKVEGLPTAQVLMWTGIAVGIYLIFHMPKFKSKLEKTVEHNELLKAQIENLDLRRQMKSTLKGSSND